MISKIHIVWYLVLFSAARTTQRTTNRTDMHSSSASRRKRGCDDRSRTAASIKQNYKSVATNRAVHHRPASRAWCGPLLLVLLVIGGVVTLFVLFACCLRSRFFSGLGRGQETSNVGKNLILMVCVITFIYHALAGNVETTLVFMRIFL